MIRITDVCNILVYDTHEAYGISNIFFKKNRSVRFIKQLRNSIRKLLDNASKVNQDHQFWIRDLLVKNIEHVGHLRPYYHIYLLVERHNARIN